MSVLSAPPAHTDAGSGGYKPAAPRKTPPKPPRKRPPVPPTTTGNPFGDLVSTATQQAKAQIDAEIAAITGQQQSELASARENARQMSLASLAGANLVKGFGTPVSDAYAKAAAALAALAGGYTGTLRSDAAANAAAVQHDLEVGGRAQGANSVPPPGSAPGQQAIDHGDALANLVYGLGGAQPATALGAAGAAAAAREAAVPETIIGHGQDLGFGGLGAAQQAIAKLAPLIAQTQAKLPGLQASILSDLANAQGKLTKSSAPKILGSASSGYYAFDPTTGKMTQILAPAPGSTRTQVFSSGGNEYAIDPSTGKVVQLTSNPRSGAGLKAVKTKGGTALVDPHTGQVVKVLPPAPSSTKTKGALSLAGARTWVGTLGRTVTLKDASGKTALNPDGSPKTQTSHKLRYMQAYKFLRRNGIADVDARTLLATSYQRGQDGRAWLTNEEQTVLARAQKSASQPGYIGLQGNHAVVRGLTKVHKYQGHAFLTPIQFKVLQENGQAPAVESGAPGGGFWISPNG